MNLYKKKLIEVALPLDVINAESAKEKTIRQNIASTSRRGGGGGSSKDTRTVHQAATPPTTQKTELKNRDNSTEFFL